MWLFAKIRAAVRNLTSKRILDEELAEEISSSIDLLTARNQRTGMSPDEARREALREFGGIEQVKEQVRAGRVGFGFETVLNDLRYGARLLFKTRTFTVTAVVALTVGIGATTLVATMIRGVLLKSLSFPDSDQLVAVGEVTPAGVLTGVPYLNYLDWQRDQRVFDEMGARLPAGGVINAQGNPERIFGRFVSASFFRTLGVQPQLGQFFTDAEDRPGGNQVMVISDALWRRHFAGDPAIVGTAVRYNGASWTVAGVMPRDFDFYGRTNDNNDFFVPLGQLEMNDTRGRGYPVRLTARLKHGVTLNEARVEMQTLARRSAVEYPQAANGNTMDVRPFLADYVGDTRRALSIMFAAVLLLLLISCANVANLTLARAMTREREIALRLAIGAPRGRVVRLLLIESLLLAAIGGIAGLGLAWGGINLLKSIAPDSLPRIGDVQLDPWSLLVSGVATVGSAVLFGVAPALQATRPNLESALKQNSGQSFGASRSTRIRNAIVIAELALSLVLLIGSGLLVQSFRELINVRPGFDSRNVLTFRLRLPDLKYPRATDAMEFVKEAHRRLKSVPGIATVAIATGFPLGRSGESNVWIEGSPEPSTPGDWPLTLSSAVNEDYFGALSIPLLAGRNFTEQDAADTPPVAIVDEQFVRQHFPNVPLTEAVGRRFLIQGADESWRQIVGIVGHVKQNGLDEQPRPEMYRPWTQLNPRHPAELLRAMDFVVKTTSDPAAMIPVVTREIHALDPELALGPTAPLDLLVHESFAPRRLNLLLITTFAFAALVLSAVGLYGVMSYAVGQRRREIGVRIALGATRTDIVRLILTNGIALTLCGIAIGLMASFGVSRLMQSLLFGVAATDLLTFTGVSLLLAGVAMISSLLPAHRATRIDPTAALRCE